MAVSGEREREREGNRNVISWSSSFGLPIFIFYFLYFGEIVMCLNNNLELFGIGVFLVMLKS